MPSTECTIHRAGLESNLTVSTIEDIAAQLSPFILRELGTDGVGVKPTVKPTRYMTKSATDELFSTLSLDEKRSKRHLKVVYDLLKKVTFHS